MFCKKCGNRLTEGEAFCAHCGAPVGGDKPFASQRHLPEPTSAPTVHARPQPEPPQAEPQQAPDAAIDAENEIETAEAGLAEPAEQTDAATDAVVPDAPETVEPPAEEQPEEAEPEEAGTEEAEPKEAADDEAEPAPEDATGEPEAAQPAKEDPAPAIAAEPPKAQPPVAAQHAPTHATAVRESRRSRRSAAWVKVLCVVCAAAILALTIVNAYTDVFKTDNDAVKTVAFSGLPDADKQSAAAFLSKFSPLYGETIDFEELSLYAFLDLVEIGDSNGLYASFFSAPKLITDKPDPADRFGKEDGYRYYKIPLASLQKIASQFDMELVGCANRADYYFVKDHYYFAAEKQAAEPAESETLDVRSSRRTEDGNYYLSCRTSGGTDVYAMVSLTKENDENHWTLLSLSASPLFTEDGLPTEQKTNKALDYEMRQSVITAKADNGTVYARYVIDYPYFKDITSRTAMTVNTLYHEIIKSYQQRANSAEEAYQKYRKKGYDKSLLPGYIYAVSTVTFNKNGTISLLDEVTTYTPETVAKQKKKAAEAAEIAAQTGMAPKEVFNEADYLFPAVTYSGYTIDTETGAFLKKDAVFGNDYRTYQQKLYAIYAANGETAADSEAVGQAIYGSPWFLAADGVRFCYQGSKGYVQFITLPYEDVPYSFE